MLLKSNIRYLFIWNIGKWQPAIIHSFYYLLHKNSTHFQVRKLQKKLRDEDGSVVMMSVWMLSFDEWLEWADYSPMLWKYNNGNMNNKPTGNVLFWSSPDLHCEVIAGQQLDTSCRGELCPVSSRCPVLVTLVLGSKNPRDATEETLTIQRSDGTNMKLDRRMPLGESCLSQEASLVTFGSESSMNSRHSAEQRCLPWYRRLPLSSLHLTRNSLVTSACNQLQCSDHGRQRIFLLRLRWDKCNVRLNLGQPGLRHSLSNPDKSCQQPDDWHKDSYEWHQKFFQKTRKDAKDAGALCNHNGASTVKVFQSATTKQENMTRTIGPRPDTRGSELSVDGRFSVTVVSDCREYTCTVPSWRANKIGPGTEPRLPGLSCDLRLAETTWLTGAMRWQWWQSRWSWAAEWRWWRCCCQWSPVTPDRTPGRGWAWRRRPWRRSRAWWAAPCPCPATWPATPPGTRWSSCSGSGRTRWRLSTVWTAEVRTLICIIG